MIPLFPIDGSTIYVAADNGDMQLVFAATTDNAADTSFVNFAVNETINRSAGEADAKGVFSAVIGAVSSLGYGEHTLLISAISESDPAVMTEKSLVFTIAAPEAGADADANCLLDDPPASLPNPGDYWLASSVNEETGARQFTVMAHVAEGAAAFAVAPAEAPWQSVVMTMPADLLYGGEEAIVVLRSAPDLVTLYGAVEASIFGLEPGALVPEGWYTEVSMLTTFPGSNDLFKISSGRLGAHPLHLTMSGLCPGTNASLFAHPTQLQVNPTTGLELIAWESDWMAQHVRNSCVTEGRIEGDVVALSAIAPFDTTLPPPRISTLPAIGYSFSYGYVEVSKTKDVTFTVMNTGADGGGRLVGEARTAAPWSFASDYTYDLAPGESAEIVVRFSPESAQGYIGNVTFTGGGGGTVVVKGIGYSTAVAPGACTGAAGSMRAEGFGGFRGDMMVMASMMAIMFCRGTRRIRRLG